MPLTHGHDSKLALHSKMLLALLNPLLDCEQLHALKFVKSEASEFVSLLNQAVEDPCHLAQDFSLLSLLRVGIWITHEYNRKNEALAKESCSKYENKLNSVSHELKSNLKLLVEEGILSVLKSVLKLSSQEQLQATAARFIWSLSHDASVKAQILEDAEIIGALQNFHTLSSLELKLASHCALWLLEILTDGMLIHTCTDSF